MGALKFCSITPTHLPQSSVLPRLILLFFLVGLTQGLFAKFPKIKPGIWRAELRLKPNITLPFLFEIKIHKGISSLTIINAQERIELRGIEIRNDSLYVSFPAYDSDLRAYIVHPGQIRGAWTNRAKKGNYFIVFEALHGRNERFNQYNPPLVNVVGRWEVTFEDNGNPYRAVGIFEGAASIDGYDSSGVSGTFLTESGDYRYLQGSVSADTLSLSTFDGSHAFYFQARYKKDTLRGTFFSGNHYQCEWWAVRNENFSLPHPDSLTYLVNSNPISFELAQADGNTYKYPNDNTRDRVTLIQIMGTWCPNCLDESIYLCEIKRRLGEAIEIIAVSFEAPVLFEDKVKRVNTYRAALGLNYTFLIGGDANKNQAHELFPMLNGILSFPTLIFIDKFGRVRKIHTGFNGPGTGVYYDNFISETTSFIEALINE